MASLIHELDNDALLLMYRADELSPEDRVEVEQMLAIDAGLRAALATVGRDAAAAEAALAAAG
jgi:anti-sigma factor RsiW